MFGSNFFGNFGIPEMQAFPYQGADPQGGMLASNAPTSVQNPMSQNAAPSGSQPIAGQPSPAGPAALGPSSPLSSASLMSGTGTGIPSSAASPGAIHTSDNTIEQTAPAAGIATSFGRPHG
jgi:hypothetical protein